MNTFERYNIVCEHAVLDEAVSKAYMMPNSTCITTLCESFVQFHSTFHYFNWLAESEDQLKEYLVLGTVAFEDETDVIHRRLQHVRALNLGYADTGYNNN